MFAGGASPVGQVWNSPRCRMLLADITGMCFRTAVADRNIISRFKEHIATYFLAEIALMNFRATRCSDVAKFDLIGQSLIESALCRTFARCIMKV